jgi:hypothetical protein
LVHFSGFGIMYHEKSGDPVASYLSESCRQWHKSVICHFVHHHYGTNVSVGASAKKLDEWRQGGQIGRIIAHWVVIYFGQFCKYNRLGYFFRKYRIYINFGKNGLGYIYSDFFHKLIWSPWMKVQSTSEKFLSFFGEWGGEVYILLFL